MTFTAYELTRQKGKPVTLYLFRYGTGASVIAYTDAEQAITYDTISYTPVAISHDGVKASGSLDKSRLTVRLPRDAVVSTKWRAWPPAQVVDLTIRQGHHGDTEFLVAWAGKVQSIGREGPECVISCEPVQSQLRRPGLRRHYQITCPHQLYQQGNGFCNASKAAGTVTGTIASISGFNLTLNAGWNGAFTNTKFREGTVEWVNDDGGTEVRQIMAVAGNVITMSGPATDLAAAETVSVILGCNRLSRQPAAGGDCGDLHNNDQNFGGCKWIPTKNPVGNRNNYW